MALVLALGVLISAAAGPVLGDEGRRLTSKYVRPISSEVMDAGKIPVNSDCPEAPCTSQVHVTLGGPFEAVVSFVSASPATPSRVAYGRNASVLPFAATGTATSYSQLLSFAGELVDPTIGLPGATKEDLLNIQNTSSWAEGTSSYSSPEKVHWGLQHYNNPQAYYNSPVVHQVTLTGLDAGDWYYQPANDGRVHRFRFPQQSQDPHATLSIGLTADLGQTSVSNGSIHALRALDPDVVLLAGDLSYADGWYSRWDSFGDLMEPLATRVPVLTCGGNHEVGSSEQWLSYNARWRMPATSSGSTDNTYWAREIGPVYAIALNSYAHTRPGSLQHTWLRDALAAVDRTRTPWIVVMMHAPWYNSNSGHFEESLLMRDDMEDLLYDAGVDIVLSGHVHSYERTRPLHRGRVDECGPVYLNLGDGGNREGTYIPWREPQPAWSAFRESSFGVGHLEIMNGTYARYRWRRHACQGSSDPSNANFERSCESQSQDGQRDNGDLVGSDDAEIVKLMECPARFKSGARPAPAAQPGSPPSNDRHVFLKVALGLSVAMNVLLLVCGVVVWVKRGSVRAGWERVRQADDGEAAEDALAVESLDAA